MEGVPWLRGKEEAQQIYRVAWAAGAATLAAVGGGGLEWVQPWRGLGQQRRWRGVCGCCLLDLSAGCSSKGVRHQQGGGPAMEGVAW